MAQALIDAPSAVLSSYNYGAALGGPPLGGVFAALAAAATAINVRQIMSAEYGGGKAMGGAVNPGTMYQVNERGPELLSVGGKDMLMMGDKGGNITPNHKLGMGMSGGMGGSNVTVVINNLPGQDVELEEGVDEEGNMMVQATIMKITQGILQGGSEISDAIEEQYGLNRAAGGV